MRGLCLLVLLILSGPAPTWAALPIYQARVVHAYPHDPAAFTEGLFYKDGFLYESTGLEGHSKIRKVELETGKVVRQHDLRPDLFGEGIVAFRGRLIQVTWRSGVGFVYDLATFKTISSFSYPGEGWALTTDGVRLILSDGTPRLRYLDPMTFQQIDDLTVTADGAPVANLNELEWVRGEILANIWFSNYIARIDPRTGHVLGWIDLRPLAAKLGPHSDNDVLNGIAYDKAHDRLFVTGKNWPKVYEIAVAPAAR